ISFTLQDDAPLSIGAGAFVDVAIDLQVDRAALVFERAPSINPVQSERPRHGLNEASAFFNLSTAQGLVARVPVFAVAEPAVSVVPVESTFADSGVVSLTADSPTTALLFEL